LNRSPDGRQRRAVILKSRIASPDYDHLPFCSVWDPSTGKPCGRPTSRAAKVGLAAFTCRYHQQHRQRHGSTWCKSPRAKTVRPYVTAALAYVEVHSEDVYINTALKALDVLMQTAGPVEIATRLRGLAPEHRAKVALARLREHGVKPERLLAIGLALAALFEEAPANMPRTREFRLVAVAKAVHRLASGTHRKWTVPQPDGSTRKIEMHAYPRSSGRVLRHLGEMIERECEWVIEKHLATVLALKIVRYGKHQSA
jgi:hypothetical protein